MADGAPRPRGTGPRGGATKGRPRSAPVSRLLARALRSAGGGAAEEIDPEILRKGIENAASKIEALPREGSFEETEEKLSDIEAALVRRLAKGLGPAAAAAVETRVAEALGETAGIPPGIVERMRRALTRREVRLRLGLPALTLF